MPMDGGAEETANSVDFLDLVKQELSPMLAQLDRLENGQQSLATKVDVMAAGMGRIYGFGNGFGNGSPESESQPLQFLRKSPASPAQAPAPPKRLSTNSTARRRSTMRGSLLLTDQWQAEEVDESISPSAEPAVLAERESIIVADRTEMPEGVEQDTDRVVGGYITNKTSFAGSCASSVSGEPMSPSIRAHKLKESQKLLEIFLLAEEEEEERLMTTESVQAQGRVSMFLKAHQKAFADKESFARWLDSWMGFIISANAIFIGISVDHEPPDGNAEPGWVFANLVFCIIFWIELVLKLSLHGFRKHFRGGGDRIMNWFDFCLVIMDTMQLAIVLIVPAILEHLGDHGLPSPSLFRVIRLLRLLRLVRLSRSEHAKDLVSMLTGLLGGAKTLLWATALFVVVMYLIALVFQEALRANKAGQADDSDFVDITEFFSDTPRSMFTVFRCSFGDCSTRSGTPIVEHMQDSFGVTTSLFFSLFLFFVVIGLFNVISAIFVESTLSAADKMQRDTKERRLSNEKLFASEVSRMMRLLLDCMPHDKLNGMSDSSNIANSKLSERMDEVMALELPCSRINQMVNDPYDGRFRVALTKLDIDPGDHRHLSSILDPDGSGKIDSVEFVSGVERLRGEPRRSDVVSVQLMIRSLQDQVEEDKVELKETVESLKQEVSEITRALDNLQHGHGVILRHVHAAHHNGSTAPPAHHESAQDRRRHQYQIHDDRSLSKSMLL